MSVRIDKWLWSVRIFKTRTKATDACKSGQVLIAGKKVKASYGLEIGEAITVKKNGFNFQYNVLKLISKRVGAPIAITCYDDITPTSELQKYKMWFSAANARPEFREKGLGRPTKKERRAIDEFKDAEDDA